jgi:IPT/TIG domain/NHL repeat
MTVPATLAGSRAWLPVATAAALLALVTSLPLGSARALAAGPTIASISPNNGPSAGGTAVTITGTGFNSSSAVKFGEAAAASATVNSSTSITATSPAGSASGSGYVEVSVTDSPGGASTPVAADQFAYDAPPSGPWLGLSGNGVGYLGPVDAFVEHNVVYDRGNALDWTAGELVEEGGKATRGAERLKVDIANGMIPVITIEYKGYRGNYESDPNFPTEEHGSTTLGEYVEGFVRSASAIRAAFPGRRILFEPMNEPWGSTTPHYNGAQYAAVIARLLPEAKAAGIPLDKIYVAAYGADMNSQGKWTRGWVPSIYQAEPELQHEIEGWYFHPYGSPSGTAFNHSEGIQSVPEVQKQMTSGQNNVIVSEVGYCAPEVAKELAASTGDKEEPCEGFTAENGAQAAQWLNEMLNNALPYRTAGWLKALVVYARGAGGWAMQLPGSALTEQGETLEAFGSAHGLTRPAFATSFAPEGIAGSFKDPQAVAVDPGGNIWIAESRQNRVLEFNPERKYVRQFGEEGSGAGQFKGIGGIATSASGEVYVIDTGNQRVQEFSPLGTYIRQFAAGYASAIAVDPEGNVWVADLGVLCGGRVAEYSPTGTYRGQFGSSGSQPGQLGIALGLAFSGGRLYVAEPGRVQQFSTSGEFIRAFDERGSGTGKSNLPWGIAADPATGDLYVSEVGNDRVQQFSPWGSFIAAFGSAGSGVGQFSGPKGLAVNSPGDIYVADTGNHRIEEWNGR